MGGAIEISQGLSGFARTLWTCWSCFSIILGLIGILDLSCKSGAAIFREMIACIRLSKGLGRRCLSLCSKLENHWRSASWKVLRIGKYMVSLHLFIVEMLSSIPISLAASGSVNDLEVSQWAKDCCSIPFLGW